jgi:uncharacterized damage-inducible protein DinB
MLETIRLLYDYTRWADGRMFDALSKLTPEQYTKDLGSSLKSVRDTTVHIVSAQWIWLSRWNGIVPKGMWNAADYPDLVSLSKPREELVRELFEFVVAQTEDSLAKPLTYKNLKGDSFSYPLGQLMLHLVNHSTYHRGQVATLIRQLGAQPISTDLVLFYAERAKRS